MLSSYYAALVFLDSVIIQTTYLTYFDDRLNLLFKSNLLSQ